MDSESESECMEDPELPDELLPAMPCEVSLEAARRFFHSEKDPDMLGAAGLLVCDAWERLTRTLPCRGKHCRVAVSAWRAAHGP